jgi:hypothetical protein
LKATLKTLFNKNFNTTGETIIMTIKLYNRNTKEATVCERPDWTKCRDHNPSKGWTSHPAGNKALKDLSDSLKNVSDSTAYTIEKYNNDADDNVDPSEENPLMSPEYNKRAAALRAKQMQDIREKGMGSNFSVFAPADSGRQDDIVWVGTCTSCNQKVFNRKDKGYWEHEVNVVGGKSITVDYCTSAREKLAQTMDNYTQKENKTDSVISLDWAFNTAEKIKNKISGNSNMPAPTQTTRSDSTEDLRCKGFTSQGTPCTLGVAPAYSNEYCHQHYKQGFSGK